MRNKLTQDKPTLFVDQWGGKIVASTAAELRAKCGGGKVAKQFCEKKDGRVVWNGYIVGARWFTALAWREVQING